MNRRITIVSATEREIQPFLDYLQKNAEQHTFQTYQFHELGIDILYSGIGILQTTYSLMDYLSHRHPDGWIQTGIGGALDPQLKLGNSYWIENEVLTGYGAEEQDGRIRDPFELGWNDPDAFPFTSGRLDCNFLKKSEQPRASGMTTFYSHGSNRSISLVKQGRTGQIENMEGAAFFYISLIKKIPFQSLRAISNFVEPRDTSKWDIHLAVENLNQHLIRHLETHAFNPDRIFDIG